MEKKTIIILLSHAILTIANAQTFRNGFDNRDKSSSGGNGQGFSYHANVKGNIHNVETVYLKGYITMFKATKDKRYLDQFIIQTKRVQERRDDNSKICNLLK